MKDIKLVFKLIPIGMAFKSQMVMMCVFLALGIVIEVLSKGETYLGGFYLAMTVLFIGQMIISLDVSTLVQSSSYKKKLQLKIPYIIESSLMLVVYTIVVLIHIGFAYFGVEGISQEENYARQAGCIFTVGLLISITAITFGVCYKYFLPAMLGFLIVFIPLLGITQNTYMGIKQYIEASIPRSVICAYLMIGIGFAISGLLARLLYRKDLSPLAFKGILNRSGK